MSLLPKEGHKPNFCLQSLHRIKPNCWYSTMPVGIKTLRKTASELLKDAGLDGYFTNHSLRRTCATHLFRAGCNVKLVKEIIGHISDVVHKYQDMSDEQRQKLSKIIQGDVPIVKLSEAAPMEVVEKPKIQSNEEIFKLDKLVLPKSHGKGDESNERSKAISTIIENAVSVVGNRRAKVTINIELLD